MLVCILEFSRSIKNRKFCEICFKCINVTIHNTTAQNYPTKLPTSIFQALLININLILNHASLICYIQIFKQCCECLMHIIDFKAELVVEEQFLDVLNYFTGQIDRLNHKENTQLSPKKCEKINLCLEVLLNYLKKVMHHKLIHHKPSKNYLELSYKNITKCLLLASKPLLRQKNLDLNHRVFEFIGLFLKWQKVLAEDLFKLSMSIITFGYKNGTFDTFLHKNDGFIDNKNLTQNFSIHNILLLFEMLMSKHPLNEWRNKDFNLMVKILGSACLKIFKPGVDEKHLAILDRIADKILSSDRLEKVFDIMENCEIGLIVRLLKEIGCVERFKSLNELKSMLEYFSTQVSKEAQKLDAIVQLKSIGAVEKSKESAIEWFKALPEHTPESSKTLEPATIKLEHNLESFSMVKVYEDPNFSLEETLKILKEDENKADNLIKNILREE